MTTPHDELPALEPRAAALLSAHRRQRAMPADARARVAARLSAPPAPVLELRPRVRGERTWVIALACAAALLLLWAAAGRHLEPAPKDSSHSLSPSHTSQPNEDRAEAKATGAHVELRPEAPALAAPPAPEAEPVPAPRAAESRPTPRRPGPALEPSSATSPRPDPSDSLRAETELLARGWRALADRDLDAALALVREHDQRFHDGALAPEREALATVVACDRDRERGQGLARDFLAAHPRSPLARRVREACGLTP